MEKTLNSSYTELVECLCCGSNDLRTVLDLNDQPLANNSLKSPDEPENTYPLKLNFCNNCTHLQLKHAVNPDLMFRNYLYVTGTSQTMHEYLKWFANFTHMMTENNNMRVLDIACNDGTLLDIYSRMGYETYGIDPSVNLYPLSSKNHNVELDYLNWDFARTNGDKFSIVVAQNVMAHNSYPMEFLQMCAEMVTDDGLIFIQNSQANMVENNEFDTIYHEHLSFYSVKSFKTLARRAGLTVVLFEKTSLHGTSGLFVLSKNPYSVETSDSDTFPLDDNVINEYADRCYDVINNLSDGLESIRSNGYKIIGYGSAAKGNTLINASGIQLDYIVDDNPLKQGLYTPGAHIEIVPPSVLESETGKICIVPLAWNYFDEISRKCESLIKSDEVIYVKYFPKFSKIGKLNA